MSNGESKIRKLKSSNTYINASFIYVLANGIGQGTTLLANFFFTRFMSQADYGLYSNYYSYVAILGPIVGANLYVGLTNAYMDYGEDIHKFRSSLLLLSFVWGSLVSCVIFGIKAIIGMPMPWIGVILALLHAYSFFAVNYYIYSMNMENRFMRKGIFLCVPNILQVFSAAIAVVICNNYISRAAGSTIGVAICGVAAILVICKEDRPQYNADYWQYALRISLPAIISSVSAMIMQQCDKVMITELFNSETTAVYALIYNIGYILYAIQQATSGVWQVWYYNTLEGKKYANVPEVQKWYMYIMFILVTGLYMVAPEVIKLLSPSNYWHFEYVIPFVIGSYLIFMYSLHTLTVQYNKRMGVVSLVISLAAMINVILNYILIPRFGGLAAAYTSVVSYLFIFVASGIYLVSKKQYYFKGRYFGIFGLGTVMMGVIFFFVKEMILVRYIMFTVLLLLEAIYAYLKKDQLKTMLGSN